MRSCVVCAVVSRDDVNKPLLGNEHRKTLEGKDGENLEATLSLAAVVA